MKHYVRLIFVLLTFGVLGCGGGGIPVTLFKEIDLSVPDQSTQTKGSVDITVTPLTPSAMYQNQDLFAFAPDQLTGDFGGAAINAWFPEDYQHSHWYYTFGPGDNILVAFRVKLHNGTDHILRMKDARVYLMIEGRDPIAAINLLGNPTLVQAQLGSNVVQRPQSYSTGDGSLVDWITREEDRYERTRKKGLLSIGYPIGLGSQIVLQNQRAYKLVNDVGREILPGTTFEGLLVLPVYTTQFQSAKLSFYDITTKTDAAGNPTEKVTFDFPIKIVDQQMWFDKEREKRWKVGAPSKTGS